jgi:hypothetical protein
VWPLMACSPNAGFGNVAARRHAYQNGHESAEHRHRSAALRV